MTNGINNLFTEIMAKISPNSEKEINTETREAYRTSNNHNQNEYSPCHIIFKASIQ